MPVLRQRLPTHTLRAVVSPGRTLQLTLRYEAGEKPLRAFVSFSIEQRPIERWRRQRERQKSNRFRLEKQELCKCISLFCTFLCRHGTTKRRKCLVSITFCGRIVHGIGATFAPGRVHSGSRAVNPRRIQVLRIDRGGMVDDVITHGT